MNKNKSFELFIDGVIKNLRVKYIRDDMLAARILRTIYRKYENDSLFTDLIETDEWKKLDEEDQKELEIIQSRNESVIDNGTLISAPMITIETPGEREKRIENKAEYYQDALPVFEPEEVQTDNSINARGEFGRTKIHLAVLSRDKKKLMELAEQGADFTVRDNSGFTPYVLAVANELPDMVEVLAEIKKNKKIKK